MHRHKDLDWSKIHTKLESDPKKLWSLYLMEETEGEPDVLGYDQATDEYFFMIVVSKAQRVGEVFVMTIRHWSPEKSSNLKIVRWAWLKRWA